ncbi:MAG: toll/interleukin-1 receptor domain-containing protein [Bacilli bacterium]|nr:toll/interleukin-1 receptor domain-containing protein [Bacilli bacterium]
MPQTTRPKAYLGNNKYIFVSYSHIDANKVYEFINILQTKYNVWFDEGIHFGREWDEEIVNKIDGCSLFIYVITNNSLNSKNCKDEIAFAKQNDIPFINVIMDDIELPTIFSFRYGRFQMLKYYEYQNKGEVLYDLERRSEEIKLTEKDREEVNDPQVKHSSFRQEEETTNTQDYALFTFEKEMSAFSVPREDNDNYFDDHGERLYRLVLLPGESMNNPVQKVEVFEVNMLDEKGKRVCFFAKEEGIDAKYAYNVLDRGYNCINIDILTNKDILYLLNKVKTMKLMTKIHSIFGAILDVEFEILFNGSVDNKQNPDIKELPDLVTFKVHHCHYRVIRH